MLLTEEGPCGRLGKNEANLRVRQLTGMLLHTMMRVGEEAFISAFPSHGLAFDTLRF